MDFLIIILPLYLWHFCKFCHYNLFLTISRVMAHFEKQSVSCRDYGFPNQYNQYNEQTSTGNRRNRMDGTVRPVRIHSMRSGCIMPMFSGLISYAYNRHSPVFTPLSHCC